MDPAFHAGSIRADALRIAGLNPDNTSLSFVPWRPQRGCFRRDRR